MPKILTEPAAALAEAAKVAIASAKITATVVERIFDFIFPMRCAAPPLETDPEWHQDTQFAKAEFEPGFEFEGFPGHRNGPVVRRRRGLSLTKRAVGDRAGVTRLLCFARGDARKKNARSASPLELRTMRAYLTSNPFPCGKGSNTCLQGRLNPALGVLPRPGKPDP